ncbi:MAG: ABC transporter ATP-binding protein [Rubrivivax sp.]|jgi:lipoprotein-releasing system ATP-binding protein|nr:ABC transporter ATP-binding protein [Rubrivivax sp.]
MTLTDDARARATPADVPLIALRAARKRYNIGLPTETEVLHGIDLNVQPGEFLALIGPSGSGKSTLLNTLGLLEGMSSGSYRLQGQETHGLDDAQTTELRRQTIGFVFQFHHLLPAFSALENVLMPGWMRHGQNPQAAEAHARGLLEAVGLGAAMHKKPGQLSGGMQQRVAIARALSLAPPLVLADEPTGNLDRRSSDEVFALLRDMHARQGTAFIIVTHDPDMARRCDRIVTLVDGLIASDSPARG